MTFAHWLGNAKDHIRRSGLRKGGRAAASELYIGAALRVFEKLPRRARTNVFDEDWDVLIVLDACRLDAFKEVATEYDWIHSVDSIRSMGSMSEEWMQASFTSQWRAEMRETGHVTWNAYSNHCLDAADWEYLDELWGDAWDDDLGALPPRPVTERAVGRWREGVADRMLVHYMQPHAPYRGLVERGVVGTLDTEQVGDPDEHRRDTIWKLLRRGDLSHDEAWNAYLDNLRWVLDDIALLRKNLDAERVVITSDHGDCFGEWGIYGHPKGVPAPELVRVPWAEISVCDTATFDPDVRAVGDGDAMERLRGLGYV